MAERPAPISYCNAGARGRVTDDFLATIAGAAIAGVIGFLTVLAQQGLERRRRLNDEVLGPAFTYVSELSNRWAWGGLEEPPWVGIDRYRWLRTPRRFRAPLDDLVARLNTYGRAYARYFEYMGEKGWQVFGAAIRKVLEPYLEPGGFALTARAVGIDSTATIQVQSLAAAIVPHVLLHPSDPTAAWQELEVDRHDTVYWANQLVRAARPINPALLQKLFESVDGCPIADEARGRVRPVLEAFRNVLVAANAAKDLLSRRLGLDEPGS